MYIMRKYLKTYKVGFNKFWITLFQDYCGSC